MSEIKSVLTRKFGPLPVWVWALLAGIGVYFYRSRTGQLTATDNTGTPTDTGSTDNTGDNSPVTLQPGETAYNPATGQTVTAPGGGTADTGLGGTGGGGASSPVPLTPGVSYFDPNTGFFTAPDIAAQPATGKIRKGVKRTAKPKPAHKPSAAKVPHPGHGKAKPRKNGSIRNAVSRAGKTAAAVGNRARSRTNHPSKQASRARVHPKVTAKPVIRQRPEASHPAPSRASQTHPAATPRSAAKGASAPRPQAPRPAARKPVRHR